MQSKECLNVSSDTQDTKTVSFDSFSLTFSNQVCPQNLPMKLSENGTRT